MYSKSRFLSVFCRRIVKARKVDRALRNVFCIVTLSSYSYIVQGRIQDFKLGGVADLKKLRRAEGGAKIVGVFRVKNHDFTPKNDIFSNFRGRAPGSAPDIG
jgi:hypothetical protein